MLRNAVLLLVIVTSLFALMACGNDHDFEAFDEFKTELLAEVDEWDNVSMINEIEMEMDGELLQHLIMEVHVDEDEDVSFVRIKDLLNDEPVILNYIYVEGDTAYTYENLGEDEDGEIEESYDIEEITDESQMIPSPYQLLLNALQSYPGEDLLENEEIDLEYETYTVEWDETSFNVFTEALLENPQTGEDESLTWSIEGDYDEFEITLPDPQAGVFTFINQDFFADFEGIDYEAHEEGAQDDDEEDDNSEEDDSEEE